ncbi:hypothetical protein CEXT_369871 [Caerostris extrusa]|uniref:Uncharacterized protein n=1 Tax=Caerostris extrusa TaxID=172846 RepID=A0AAV4UP47_CAEEX|nr:hypothetical protein CEXT_369871 [Caerostris extrusa]
MTMSTLSNSSSEDLSSVDRDPFRGRFARAFSALAWGCPETMSPMRPIVTSNGIPCRHAFALQFVNADVIKITISGKVLKETRLAISAHLHPFDTLTMCHVLSIHSFIHCLISPLNFDVVRRKTAVM